MPGAEQLAELQLPVKPCKQLVTEKPRTRVNKTHSTDSISCTHHHGCYLNFIRREGGIKEAKYGTCQEQQGPQAMVYQTTWLQLANLLPVAKESFLPLYTAPPHEAPTSNAAAGESHHLQQYIEWLHSITLTQSSQLQISLPWEKVFMAFNFFLCCNWPYHSFCC